MYFLHANGFPPKAYTPLLTHLTNNFIVEAPLMRPLWKDPPEEPIKTWEILGDDFIKFTEQRNINPIIGVGHSIGGTLILYSAIQRPNLFSKIFLLDPVLQPLSYHYGWRIAKKIGLAAKVNPMVGSKLRRKNFGSKDEIFKRYRKKNVFSKLSDEALNIYIENSTREMGNGKIELIYSPKLEEEIYLSGLMIDPKIWKGIKNINIPITILHTLKSIEFPQSSRKKFGKLNNRCKMIELNDCSHLFPMEIPDKVYSMIYEM